MPDERTVWNERYRNGCPPLTVPNRFLADAYTRFVEPRFPEPGTALDLAGGAGRHAIWLAERGWRVTLMDISSEGLVLARQNAGAASVRIEFLQADLRTFQAERKFDLVLVFYYLERAILRQVERSLPLAVCCCTRPTSATRQTLPSIRGIQPTCWSRASCRTCFRD